VTPEQRREAIARLLEDCPDASQRAIAEAVVQPGDGCRDMGEAIRRIVGDSH